MTIGRISLCDTSFESCRKSTTICIENLFVVFHFWGRYGLKTEKKCWIWLLTVSQWSILTIFLFYMKEYLIAYISSSKVTFWNINHERIMDTFCHFSSLYWTIYCGFVPMVHQISSLNWCIIGHVMQILRFSITRVVVYHPPLVSIMHSCCSCLCIEPYQTGT